MIPADVDLDLDQLVGLNERFYEGLAPADFFEARLRLLVKAAATGWPTSSISYERFHLPPPRGDALSNWGPVLVTVEALNVFHHTAEAAWLLLLSHERPEGCPRLAMARIRSREMKQRVRDFVALNEAERIQRIRNGLGLDEAAGAIGDAESLGARLAGTDLLLKHLADQLLRQAPLYNATKHGFGVDGGRARIEFVTELQDRDVGLSRDAMWLTNLEYRDSQERSKWVNAHTAVEADRLMALTALAIDLIRSIWSTGRARFGNDSGATAVINLPLVEEVQGRAYEPGMRIERALIELEYRDDNERQITMEGSHFPVPETGP